MPTPSPELIEIASRHQAQYERLKSHEVKSFDNFLKLLDEDLRKQLSRSDLTLFTRSRLEKQLALIREIIRGIYDDYEKTWRDSMIEAAKYEAEFEKTALDRVVINHEFVLPTENQISAAVFTRPLSVEGINKGALLDQFFRGLPDSTIKRVEGAIRLGFAQGQTTQQVIQRIRGTAKAKYTDGLMALSRRDADLITRTALQHVSSQARFATWDRNRDIIKGVQWVSTLDSRTSNLCRSLSGRVFPIDKGPRPPAHINCLPGDAYITASGDITGVSKRWFDGEMVSIKTSNGRFITCTPNHPILTDKGWIAAGNINSGDQVICNVSVNRESIINAQDNDSHPTIREITESFLASGEVRAMPVPMTAPDFHGDGANSEIAIIGANRNLLRKFDTAISKEPSNSNFVFRNNPLGFFGHTAESFKIIFFTPDRIIRFFSKPANFFYRSIGHSGVLLFRSVPYSKSMLSENSFYRTSACSIFFSEKGYPFSLIKKRYAFRFIDTRVKDFSLSSILGLCSDTLTQNRMVANGHNSACIFQKHAIHIKFHDLIKLVVSDCLADFRRKFLLLFFGSNGNSASFERINNDTSANSSNFISDSSRCISETIKRDDFIVVDAFGGKIRYRFYRDPAAYERSSKANLADAELAGECRNGNVLGLVEKDSVTECFRSNFSGHVFNLETIDGCYSANGIITHNCRSTVVSVLDDRFKVLDEGATQAARGEDGEVVKVDANETYYSWLRKQSASFQDSIIGPTRGKLLRNGGLSAERFAEINLNKDFSPATLDEMREMDILAFERAGL